MALGFDQGINWDYIPLILTPNNITSDAQICSSELLTFISRLQEPSTQTYLTHPIILSALSSRTLLHAALCTTNGHICRSMLNFNNNHIDSPRGSEFDLALCAGRKRDAIEIPLHTYVLRNMQSPRPAILVFILVILLAIKDKACSSANEDLLEPTLSHLFLAMGKALYEIDFDWYPYDLETVLTYLIRGVDLFRVSCPGVKDGKGEPCLLCKNGVFDGRPEKGSLFEGERFPDWGIVFRVARVVGGMRMLEKETRKMLEGAMRDLFFAGDEGSGRICVLGCGDIGQKQGAESVAVQVEVMALREVKEKVCLELGVT